jgi:hypothetical protein
MENQDQVGIVDAVQEHPVVTRIKDLLRDCERLSAHELDRIRLMITVYRIECGDELLRLMQMGFVRDCQFSTSRCLNETMCLDVDSDTSNGGTGRLQFRVFYQEGLLDCDGSLTDPMHHVRAVTIENIVEKAATA